MSREAGYGIQVGRFASNACPGKVLLPSRATASFPDWTYSRCSALTSTSPPSLMCVAPKWRGGSSPHEGFLAGLGSV